jgi:hypothetical protein
MSTSNPTTLKDDSQATSLGEGQRLGFGQRLVRAFNRFAGPLPNCEASSEFERVFRAVEMYVVLYQAEHVLVIVDVHGDTRRPSILKYTFRPETAEDDLFDLIAATFKDLAIVLHGHGAAVINIAPSSPPGLPTTSIYFHGAAHGARSQTGGWREFADALANSKWSKTAHQMPATAQENYEELESDGPSFDEIN